ncbi:3-hydroxypropionyl-coenzyme A dehydratase-like protein [Emericellopsis cladophorae]|uniref:3-hydroxypropionyl-coenzyme A dehydratase-like protein n=1 Tax=Emericellopsis cladophorae TaxID=2686198 RepID=A0A9P9XYG2_9HYPO|nr:3-hydroxypropionyl-coenzyme A dehydratase-like protein [Emericellopsis cladophorae]KAI6779760.1 3-hydroxypropionyl-coenzyme A dehydratase-like protein [Emericellopsis cladophorae]
MPRLYHLNDGPRFLTLSHNIFPQSVVMSQTFSSPPPSVPDVLVTSPVPHVLLVTLNRPKALNAMQREMHYRLDKLWSWFDAEPTLRVAVLTGSGRAFCAGADLKEWNDKHKDGKAQEEPQPLEKWNENGFGGLSNRRGKKPVIAAVNGLCLGGGMEIAINCDMVIAHESAQFGLPETKIGVVALAGALPRLTRLVGRARASEMAFTGRSYPPTTMLDWGVINKIVKGNVVQEALKWAGEVANNSPDSIIVSREGIMSGWAPEDPQDATRRVEFGIYKEMDGAQNMKEGVLSFVERRKAVWRDSKL